MATLIDADPYPWPHGDDLGGQQLALVVAGAQRRFMQLSTGINAVCASIARLAGAVKGSGGIVVVLRHGRPRGAPIGRRGRLWLPEEGTEDWQVGIPLDDGTYVVNAGGLDGFYGSGLDQLLRATRRTQLVLAGFASEVCVDSTLRRANDQGYECLVVRDACAPLDPDIGERTLHSVTMSGGIFGAVGTTQSFVAALTGAAVGGVS